MSQVQNSAAPVFVLDPNPTIRWPVTVRIPVDGGQLATCRFEALIRVYSEEDFERIVASRPQPGVDDKGNPKVPTMKEVLADHAARLPSFVVDWFGVVDGDRKPVPIAALPEQLLYGAYGKALSRGLWDAINEVRYGLEPTQGGATLGNSGTLPADGPGSPPPPTN